MPFALLLTRATGIDIRTVGSGNIGTTNVLRSGNKGLVAATLLLDAGKEAAVLARRFEGEAAGMLAGVAAPVARLAGALANRYSWVGGLASAVVAPGAAWRLAIGDGTSVWNRAGEAVELRH